MPAACERLRAVVPASDLARRLSLMFEALPRDPQTSVTQAKLKAMQAVAASQLFQDRGQSRGSGPGSAGAAASGQNQDIIGQGSVLMSGTQGAGKGTGAERVR